MSCLPLSWAEKRVTVECLLVGGNGYPCCWLVAAAGIAGEIEGDWPPSGINVNGIARGQTVTGLCNGRVCWSRRHPSRLPWHPCCSSGPLSERGGVLLPHGNVLRESPTCLGHTPSCPSLSHTHLHATPLPTPPMLPPPTAVVRRTLTRPELIRIQSCYAWHHSGHHFPIWISVPFRERGRQGLVSPVLSRRLVCLGQGPEGSA